jgi:hypothetical protein
VQSFVSLLHKSYICTCLKHRSQQQWQKQNCMEEEEEVNRSTAAFGYLCPNDPGKDVGDQAVGVVAAVEKVGAKPACRRLNVRALRESQFTCGVSSYSKRGFRHVQEAL